MTPEEHAVLVSLGNRRYLKFTIGALVAILITIGAGLNEARVMRDTVRNAATKGDLLEVADAVHKLAAVQDSSLKWIIRHDVWSNARSSEIGSSLDDVKMKIEKMEDDRIQYRWDRGQLQKPHEPPQRLATLRDVLLGDTP